MTIANKNDANSEAVRAAVASVRQALGDSPETTEIARALEQCDRLELALGQAHAEGIRFAAFTLLRMVLSHGTAFTEPVQLATRRLKEALEAAGLPH